MKQCSICKADLGVFASKYACLDGYVCDDCYFKAKTKKTRKNVTVQNVKDGLFNKKRTEERELRSIKAAHNINQSNSTALSSSWKDYRYFSVSHSNKQFKIQKDDTVYNFDQLISYELVEDDKTITKSKGGVGRAIVGGVLAGGVGAVVGATTGKTESTDVVTQLYITIVTGPIAKNHTISFIFSEVKKGGFIYNAHMALARQIIAELKIIEKSNNDDMLQAQDIQEKNNQTQDISVPYEELKQLKELLDMGVITQQDFDAKKKQLLGI